MGSDHNVVCFLGVLYGQCKRERGRPHHTEKRASAGRSPYLSIICVEGLSALFRKAEREGRFHRVQVCPRSPSITHLLFTDDSFFFRASADECFKIRQILNEYDRASSQAINFTISGTYFSSNTSNELRSYLNNIMGTHTGIDHCRYLRLPSLIGRNKRSIFAFLKNMLSNRLNNWNKKFLSKAGKETLLKSVAQALPTFCTSVFLLPQSLCAELQKMINSFWWEERTMGRGTYIGNHGKQCVTARFAEEWAFATSINSILQCLENSAGDYCAIRTRYLPSPSKQNIFQMGTFYLLVWVPTQVLPGRVWWLQKIWC